MRLCRFYNPLVPFFACLLWMVNPLHTQSVTYLVQRMNSLAVMFYMLGLVLYIRARLLQLNDTDANIKITGLFITCAFSGLLGMVSKQIAVTLPVIIFLYEWYFFQNLDSQWIRRQIKWIGLIIVPVFASAFIFLGSDPLSTLLSRYENHDFNMYQRLMAEPRVVIYYLSLLFFPNPARLNLDYDFIFSKSFFDPAVTVLSMITLLVLFVVSVINARRHRLLSFAILWFLINLVVESSVIGLELIFEHRTYLPSIFPFIVLSVVVFRYIKPVQLTVAGLCTLTCICGFWTFQRNAVWNDKIVFWQDCVKKSPEKSRTVNNLGLAYSEHGEYSQAIGAYQKSLDIRLKNKGRFHLDTAESYNNLGVAYDMKGAYSRSIFYFNKVLDIRMDKLGSDHLETAGVYNNLGAVHNKTGDYDRAIDFFHKALNIRIKKLGPEHSVTAEVYSNLGTVYKNNKDFSRAEAYYQKALDLKIKSSGPDHPETAMLYNNLGGLFKSIGKYGRALEYYHKALDVWKIKLGPEHPGMAIIYNNFGAAYGHQGDYDQAIYYFNMALDLCHKKLGENHPTTQQTRENLNYVLKNKQNNM